METSGTIAATTGTVGGARDFEAGDTEYAAVSNRTAIRWGDGLVYGRAILTFESLTGQQTWYDRYNTSGNNRSYRFAWNIGSDARISLTASSNGTSFSDVKSNAYVTNVGAITTGVAYLVQWYHNPTTNQIAIGVNGHWDVSSHSGGFYQNSQPLHLGAQSDVANYFDGTLDEVAVVLGHDLDYADWGADEYDMLFDPSSMATFGSLTDNTGGAPATRRFLTLLGVG